MKRLSFMARLGALAAAPLVPIEMRMASSPDPADFAYPEALVKDTSAFTSDLEGVWLRFGINGSSWSGVFRASATDAARLEQLRPLGIDAVEWWERGKLFGTNSLDSAIRCFETPGDIESLYADGHLPQRLAFP